MKDVICTQYAPNMHTMCKQYNVQERERTCLSFVLNFFYLCWVLFKMLTNFPNILLAIARRIGALEGNAIEITTIFTIVITISITIFTIFISIITTVTISNYYNYYLLIPLLSPQIPTDTTTTTITCIAGGMAEGSWARWPPDIGLQGLLWSLWWEVIIDNDDWWWSRRWSLWW